MCNVLHRILVFPREQVFQRDRVIDIKPPLLPRIRIAAHGMVKAAIVHPLRRVCPVCRFLDCHFLGVIFWKMGPPEVRAVLFKGPNQPGDFNYMISRDKYKDTLFLISENVHDMLYTVMTLVVALLSYICTVMVMSKTTNGRLLRGFQRVGLLRVDSLQ